MLTQILGHRGASAEAPENTMVAFALAAQMGADGVELDVHLTSDGRVVVIHDDTVDRTTNGTGAVREMTFAQIRELDASIGKPGYSGAKIPTLEEVYELLQPTGMVVNVEIKENAYDHGFLIIPKVLELETRYEMTGRIIYSSFNHYVLREMKECSAQIPTAILYSEALVDVWQYAAQVPADGIHPYFEMLADPMLVTRCHESGQAVRPWTVNEENNLREMFRQGVDTIITNFPDRALRLRQEIQGGELPLTPTSHYVC
jgi:Glycerophosphoryl diester phosphodiesterase